MKRRNRDEKEMRIKKDEDGREIHVFFMTWVFQGIERDDVLKWDREKKSERGKNFKERRERILWMISQLVFILFFRPLNFHLVHGHDNWIFSSLVSKKFPNFFFPLFSLSLCSRNFWIEQNFEALNQTKNLDIIFFSDMESSFISFCFLSFSISLSLSIFLSHCCFFFHLLFIICLSTLVWTAFIQKS